MEMSIQTWEVGYNDSIGDPDAESNGNNDNNGDRDADTNGNNGDRDADTNGDNDSNDIITERFLKLESNFN